MLKFVSAKLRVPHQNFPTFPLTFKKVHIGTQSEPLQKVTKLVQLLQERCQEVISQLQNIKKGHKVGIIYFHFPLSILAL